MIPQPETFQPLFELVWSHDYFKNGRLKSYKVKPTGKTALSLKRYGILAKFISGNFTLLAEKRIIDWLRLDSVQANGIFPLCFFLNPLDPYFGEYSDLPRKTDKDKLFLISFTNSTDGAIDLLNEIDFLKAKDLSKLKVDEFEKAKVINEISENGNKSGWGLLKIDKACLTISTSFSISLKARKVYWKYVLVKTYRKEELPESMSIVADNEFRLIKDKTDIYFLSTSQLPLQESDVNKYQLLGGPLDKKPVELVANLPKPDANRIVLIEVDKKPAYCAEVIVHI